jgi:hypothetical protein
VITKLSDEQEALLPIYRDKWLQIGLSTERCDREACTEICQRLYKHILKRKRPMVVFMDSPLSAFLASCAFIFDLDQMRSLVDDQNHYSPIRTNLSSQVVNQVGFNTGHQVWNQVGNQVRNQVRNQVESQVRDRVQRFFFPYLSGSLDSSYMSFYDYFHEVVGIEYTPLWEIYRRTTMMGPVYTLENFCIVSEKPLEIHMHDGVLHRDGGPSIAYADGLRAWSLNGVQVTQEIAETPADELDPRLALNQSLSVDVRREVLRKIGTKRFVARLGAKSIHSDTVLTQDGRFHKYELLELELNGITCRALQMNNPSLDGVTHVEFVHEDCQTVAHALLWREGIDEFRNVEYIAPQWIR